MVKRCHHLYLGHGDSVKVRAVSPRCFDYLHVRIIQPIPLRLRELSLSLPLFPLFFRGFRIWVVEHQRTKIDSWLELRVSVVGVRTKETDEALIVPPHILRRQFFSFNFVHCTTLIVQCNSPAMSNVNE